MSYGNLREPYHEFSFILLYYNFVKISENDILFAMNFKKAKRKCYRPFEYCFLLFLYCVCRCLTYPGGIKRLASFLGFFLYLIPSVKKLLIANLETAFPDFSSEKHIGIAKKAAGNIILVYLEFFWFYKREDRISKFINISDETKKHFEILNNKDKASIILTMHIGNWELVAFASNLELKERLHIVSRKVKNPFIENFLKEGRTWAGSKIIHEKGAAKQVFKALRKQEITGLLIDQNTKINQGGTFANFFDLPVAVSKTPASLARKLKTNIIFLNSIRTESGFELISSQKNINYDSDEELTQALLSDMQHLIEKYPDQWVWLYNRWNYIPENQPELKDKYPFYSIMES